VEYLLESQANVNQADERGGLALHAASARSNIKVLELLLQKGSALDAATVDGYVAISCLLPPCPSPQPESQEID